MKTTNFTSASFLRPPPKLAIVPTPTPPVSAPCAHTLFSRTVTTPLSPLPVPSKYAVKRTQIPLVCTRSELPWQPLPVAASLPGSLGCDDLNTVANA
ncbi:unnamed protein product [Mesocestoides corti]|uniref:Uncharacterized protein n=1 Tax=Mesocestoides corti TaxID=53468 RepID=A0A0R3UQF9_MESCO|nr:unnamed protein product [Mesocestoides corti]